MGTWGTGITSSDIFKDIYDDFFNFIIMVIILN